MKPGLARNEVTGLFPDAARRDAEPGPAVGGGGGAGSTRPRPVPSRDGRAGCRPRARFVVGGGQSDARAETNRPDRPKAGAAAAVFPPVFIWF